MTSQGLQETSDSVPPDHIISPLDDKNLSFLSGGITVKGIYNMMDSISEVAPSKNSFIPNIDAGVYYYGQNLFAGISAGNLLGNMLDSADNEIYNVPVSRQYFLIAGYKFVVSRSLNIILEPSLIINLDDSLNFDKKETYNPMLKLYMEDFCIGAYLHNYNNTDLFLSVQISEAISWAHWLISQGMYLFIRRIW